MGFFAVRTQSSCASVFTCSSRNEQRDEKWFCSDSLALCVWQTMFVSGEFARQMVVITVVMSLNLACHRLGSAYPNISGTCSRPRASTLRMRLADDLGLVPSLHESVRTTYGRRRLFLALCSMWQKVMVLRMPLRSRMRMVMHVMCSGVQTAWGSSLRLLEHFGDFGRLFLLQCMHLCPSSSETRSVTCLICELWR